MLSTTIAKLQIANSYGSTVELCRHLGSSPTDGLADDAEDLKQRRLIFGRNEIPTEKPQTFLQLCWEAIQVSYIIPSNLNIISSQCFAIYQNLYIS